MRDHGVMLATANPLELQLSEKIVEIVPSADMVLLNVPAVRRRTTPSGWHTESPGGHVY